MKNEKRLIDAERTEEAVKISDKPAWMVVRDMPTVDAVEVVHGQKRKAFAYSIVVDRQCSLCAAYVSFIDNYCPHCGALLDLEE